MTRGASLFIGGKGVNNALRFLINLLLTRGLGTSQYGIYALGSTIMTISYGLANLGTDQSILRFIPEYDGDRANQNRVLGLASLTSFLGGVLAAAALYALAPVVTELTLGTPLLTDVLRLFAIILPINSLINIIKSLFKSLELPEYQVILENALPAIRLLAVGIALFVGASVVGVVAAIVVGFVLAFGFALMLAFSRTSFRPTLGNSRENLIEFYDFSLPLTVSQMGTILQRRIDILMVGFFLSGSAVGIYNIASVLSNFLLLPLTAFSQLFPPIASRLYANGERDELNSLYTRVTRWSFTLALLPTLGAALYTEEVLSIFGEDFADGGVVLSLFVLGQLTNVVVGPSGYVLMMTGHQYLTLVNEWTLGILNIVFNYLFITEFGFIGAALATALTLTAINVVRIVQVWYIEQLLPYSLKFLKPIAAGLGAGAVMYGLRFVLSGFPLLVVGGAAGAVVFVAGLVVLGIENEDREFFATVLPIGG
ncbi:flippase [Halobium palmae]|uniref:Flippase n=1 Tax=Halobium palmae TaxID=1776492 RepID=A0ABD5RW00_9EURY